MRDEQWHRQSLKELGDVIIDMLDNSDHVTAHLSSSTFPKEYKPENLLEQIEKGKAEEESKRQSFEQKFDFQAYYKKLPADTKFERFASYPKDIVIEYVMKGLDFYLELDN